MGSPGTTADLAVIAGLQKTLRAGEWSVTAAVRADGRIVAVYPSLKDRTFGVAVDIGSTTIAAHLTDLLSGEVVASSAS